MQFTLFTYFQSSSKTFLLLILLAPRARSRLLQLTRCSNYLLTNLLTYIDDHKSKIANRSADVRQGAPDRQDKRHQNDVEEALASWARPGDV